MAFEKGISGNPEGRPRGSRNRITAELQERIGSFLIENITKLQQEYDQLSPSEKLRFITSLLQYVVPRVRDIEEPPVKEERGALYKMINAQFPNWDRNR